MLGSCVVDTPNGSLDCHREVNSTKKTIEDFFGKSSQNNSSAVKKPMNLLNYFTKDPNNSRVSNVRTEALVGSSVLENLAPLPLENDMVKKNLTASSLDKNSSEASSLDKNTSKASSLDKNTSKASSLDKNTSKASSLDKNTSKGSSLDKNTSKASSLDKNTSEASSLDKNTSEASSLDKNTSEASSLNKNTSEASSLDKNTSEASSLDKNTSEASSLDKNTSEASSSDKNTSKASSLDKNTSNASSLDKNSPKASSLDKNTSKVSSLDKNTSKVSSLDKNSSNASSLDKKRKRANKQVLSGDDDDFVENAQSKRFKSTDSISSENSKTTIPLPSNESQPEKIPQNISNTESKTVDPIIDHSDDDHDFISKSDATSKKVVLCKNDQELSKRKYTKKNSKNCIKSSDNNKNEMLNKQSKLKSSKTQQVNVGKSNPLDKYYSEKDKTEQTNNCKKEKEKTESNNSSDPPQNSKEISLSNSCNSIIANNQLDPSSLTYLNTKSDLDESSQSLKVQTCENDDENAMELSYEEFLLSQTVSEEDSVNMESAKMSPEKASPSKCDSVPMFVDSVKTDICDSQQVTIVADIHPEPSLNLPTTSNATDNSSKSAEAVLKKVSSEVIKSKHQDVDDIIVLDTEMLNKADEILVDDDDDVSRKEQQKRTKSSLDVIRKKAIPSHKSKSVSKAKNQKPALISNSIGVKCSQSTLNFEQRNLDLHSKSVSAISVGKSKGTLKTLSKRSKTGAKIIVRQQNKSVHKKDQSRDVVKSKGKKTVNGAKQNRNHNLPAASGQPNKIKHKINKKINKKKSVKVSTKPSVPKVVKKSKASPSEDKTMEAEVSEVKNGSTASADGNSKDNLNLSKKSVKPKLDSIGQVGLEEISTSSTRKSLRLQEKKAVPTSCDDFVILDEVPIAKEEESKVNPKATLGSKDKSLNNEKISQKGGKLAPIFMKNSNKKDGKKCKELETEEDRLRRAFLMSGLPEEAKRQQQTINNTVSAVCCDHAPFPSESHVQQIEPTAAEINHWDLPEVNLPLIKLAPAENQTIKPPPWNGSFSVVTETPAPNIRVNHLKKFSGHSPLSASEIKTILQEISAANPSYPAQHFYDMALKRNKVAEKSEKASAKSETGKETVNAEEADGTTEENQKGKRKSKRGLSRRKSNKKAADPDPKADCQKPEETDANSEEKVCDILWTEKYQPLHSSEIICNSSNVKKLKSWLSDWKQLTDREARKLKKLLMKQKKSKKNKEEDSNSTLSWNDDDSDFALSPSESEDDSLCNTKLLTGPQGIGKTASVYALAMELGYQVFEMNASSVRSGKKILTRLQEATQSHQVSKDKSDSTVSSQPSTDVPNAPLKNLAPSFSTFFKTSVNNTPSDKSCKSEKNSIGTSSAGKLPNNKRKKNEKDVLPVKNNAIPRCVFRKSSENGAWKKIDLGGANLDNSLSSSDKVSKRLNIASTSLILFDEVDIVFEEDKGFWTAILQFMSSTKRPIILTSTSADFSEQFSGSCEPLHFNMPSMKTLTSHLQTLCLAENVVTKASEISDLVTYYSGDVRSCLLALQFWVESGASGSPVNIPLSHISRSNPSSLTENSNKPETDAVHTENSKKVAEKQGEQLELKDNGDVSKQEFAAHLHFLESYLAIDPVQLQLLHLENETSKTPIDVNQLDNITRACQHCYSQNFYLCRRIFLSRLCLPQTTLPSFDLSLRALKKKVTKPDVPEAMQKLKSDLYDSETSCDDVICQTVKEQSCTTDGNEIKPLENCSEECVVSNTVEDNDLEAHQKTSPLSNLDENTMLPSQEESSDWKTLRGITKFYDCCSDIDIFLTSCCSSEPSFNPNAPRSVNFHSSLSPGLWDEFPIVSNELRHSQTFTEHAVDIAAHMEVRSYLKCRQDVASSNHTADLRQLQQNTSTSTPCHHSEFVKPSQQQDRSVSLARQKAVENVIHYLPINQSLNSNLVFLDYFPVLRNICRTEKIRQLAKVKRRFFHYFDNINLPLKESTLNILSSDFT